MNTGRETEQEMSAVPLQQAVLCVNCETISNSPHDVCEVCGSRSLVNLFRMVGGTLLGKQPEELVRYNVELTIKVHELSATDLNRAIATLTQLAELSNGVDAMHMNVESVLRTRPEHVLKVA